MNRLRMVHDYRSCRWTRTFFVRHAQDDRSIKNWGGGGMKNVLARFTPKRLSAVTAALLSLLSFGLFRLPL
ncbi:hypothetical protein [Nitrosomonas marina]|uniref:hypothetical protein n=1 Tax=Nitrosomonas marina TaxID=917 RepID=UPI001FE04B8C|nr:hypothetical protein [Nitrosomonas marina]